jgi:hypothetical protein
MVTPTTICVELLPDDSARSAVPGRIWLVPVVVTTVGVCGEVGASGGGAVFDDVGGPGEPALEGTVESIAPACDELLAGPDAVRVLALPVRGVDVLALEGESCAAVADVGEDEPVPGDAVRGVLVVAVVAADPVPLEARVVDVVALASVPVAVRVVDALAEAGEVAMEAPVLSGGTTPVAGPPLLLLLLLLLADTRVEELDEVLAGGVVVELAGMEEEEEVLVGGVVTMVRVVGEVVVLEQVAER